MRTGDTIVALSTGAPPSGVAVIRLSGPQTRNILSGMAGTLPLPRHLTLRAIGQGSTLDRGLIAWFPAPNSFTGEDCAELQVHGSPAGVKAIIRLATQLGARLAEAGEFTRRAFENGKLDLVEVEGLGDLLEAETENQRRQALARLEGGLSTEIETLRNALLDLRAEIEARLDFSDEGDVADALPASFAQSLAALQSAISKALGRFNSGRITRQGIRVALAGPPNAGKSSLLNALAKADIAIVTDEAGTTRDVREVPLDIDGQLYILLDLAGLRDTESRAEAEGVRRARMEVERADIVLWLSAPDLPYDAPPSSDFVHVGTKTDQGSVQGVALAISARTGAGIAELVSVVKHRGDALLKGEPSILSHERDRLALQEALNALAQTSEQLDLPELAAESLRSASQALERLLGRIDNERVLDRLFSSFCIGK